MILFIRRAFVLAVVNFSSRAEIAWDGKRDAIRRLFHFWQDVVTDELASSGIYSANLT